MREPECLPPKVKHHSYTAVEDASGAVGKHKDLLEHFERSQTRNHKDKDDLRTEARHADGPVLLQITGTVDYRRIVKLLRNVLQSCEKDHRIVANAHPDGHEHRDWQSVGWFGQP